MGDLREHTRSDSRSEPPCTAEDLPIYYAALTANAEWVTVGASLRRVLGESSAFAGESIRDRLHAEDMEATMELIATLPVDSTRRSRFRIRTTNDDYQALDGQFTLEADGKVYLVARSADIFAELSRKADFYESVVEYSPGLFIGVDARTSLVNACNQTAARVLGYDKTEILGRSVMELYHPDCMESAREAFETFADCGEVRNLELILQRKDGTPLDVSLSVTGIRDESIAIVSSRSIRRDITEQKELRRSLRQSRKNLRSMVRYFPRPVVMLDRGLKVLEYSDAYANAFAYEEQDLRGLEFSSCFPYHSSELKQDVERGLAGESSQCAEIELDKVDGGREWLGWELRPWYSVAGDISGVILVVEILTARKAAEFEQAVNAARLDAIVQNAAVGIAMVSMEGVPLMVNQAFADLLEYSPEEMCAMHFADFTYPPDAEIDLAHFQRLNDGEIASYDMQKRYITKSGALTWAGLHVSLVRSPNGDPMYAVAIVLDLNTRKEAEQLAERNAAEIGMLVQYTDAAVWLLNADARLEVFNDACEAMFRNVFGIEIEKSVRLPDLLREKDARLAEAMIADTAQALAGKSSRRTLHTRATGEDLYLEVSINPIFEGERIARIAAFARDVSSLKKSEIDAKRLNVELERRVLQRTEDLEKLNDRLRAGERQASFLKEIVIGVNSTETPEDLARTAAEYIANYTGWPVARATLLPSPDSDHSMVSTWHCGEDASNLAALRELEHEFSAAAQDLLARSSEDDSKNESCIRILANAGLRDYEAFAFAVRIDGLAAIVLQFFFPAHMRPAAAQLNLFEEEVAAQLAYALKRQRIEANLLRAKQAADAANHAKGNFLANMSHEIRTPMNAVLGMTHLALNTDLSEKQRDYLNKIQTSANSLLGIINDILDFSKIEAGKLDLESADFSLREIFQNLSDIVAAQAEEKGLELGFFMPPELPDRFNGDPLRLVQVLVNLASNAIKFTDAGEVLVSVDLQSARPAERDLLRLKFSVSDTGIGLSPEQVDGLFDAFSQADVSTTRRYGGTGLGLSICKRIVSLLNGEIWVESEPGKGSTFHFTSDFRLARGGAVALHHLPDVRDLRVLAIDDSESSRRVLQSMLDSFSFRVETAKSGQAGCQLLNNLARTDPFDIVLVDWKMPGMDGFQTAEQIRKLCAPGSRPVIIMVTAFSNESIRKRAEQNGNIDGVVIKPVQQSVLFETILQCIYSNTSPREPAVSPEESEGPSLPASKGKSIAGTRILLVEDNAINQQVAVEILHSHRALVSTAENGEVALRMLAEESPEHFDLILMDVQMPVMDGYTATRSIRSGPAKTNSIPIIAMTATAMEGDRDRALASGMNDYITKPIDPQRLLAVVAQYSQSGGAAMDSLPAKPKVQTTPGMRALEHIDVIDGLNRLGGNVAGYRSLLIEFADSFENVAHKVEVAMQSGDIEQAKTLLHNLQGAAGNLGARDLMHAAAKLENELESADDTRIAKLQKYFRDKHRASIESIRGGLGGDSDFPGAPELLPIGVVRERLQTIVGLVRAQETRALAELDGIGGSLRHFGQHGEYAAARSELRKYEFAAAGSRIAKILERLDNLHRSEDRDAG